MRIYCDDAMIYLRNYRRRAILQIIDKTCNSFSISPKLGTYLDRIFSRNLSGFYIAAGHTAQLFLLKNSHAFFPWQKSSYMLHDHIKDISYAQRKQKEYM